MNDDLEERLASLRPATPPRELMRRLRSAASSEPAKRFQPWMVALLDAVIGPWPLALAGMLAAAALIFALQLTFRPDHPQPLRRAPIILTNVDPKHVVAVIDTRGVAARNPPQPEQQPGASFDLQFAALGNTLNPRASGGFHLETPSGPIRLDCGYALPGNEPASGLLGRFNFDARDSF